jgi:hypothetical protein
VGIPYNQGILKPADAHTLLAGNLNQRTMPMPTKKEATRSSSGMRTAVKKAESTQISATRVAAKTHDETKPSSTPASARAKAGHKDPAPPAIVKPTPKQAAAARLPTQSAAETKSSPKPSRTTHVKASPDNATVSDKPAPRAHAPAAAPSAGAHPPQAEPAVIDKAAAPVTRIMADADIGHGNILYLRGEGGGLSWDTGVAMNNDGDNKWSWVVESTDEHITFKFVINDLMWSEGDNLTVAQGKTSVSTPSF